MLTIFIFSLLNLFINHIKADSVAEVLLKLDPITVQNKTYAVLTKLDIELVLKSGQIRLENLFGGKEPELNDLVHQAMNDNFLTLGKEFFPLSERILSEALSKIINKFLGRFTEEQLFPH